MSNTRSSSVSAQSRTTSRPVSYTTFGSIAAPPPLPFHVSGRTGRGQATSPVCDHLDRTHRHVLTLRVRLPAITTVRRARTGFLPVPGLPVRRSGDLEVRRPADRPVRRLADLLPRPDLPVLGRPAGDVARGGGDLRVPPGRTRARTVQGAGRLLAVPG